MYSNVSNTRFTARPFGDTHGAHYVYVFRVPDNEGWRYSPYGDRSDSQHGAKTSDCAPQATVNEPSLGKHIREGAGPSSARTSIARKALPELGARRQRASIVSEQSDAMKSSDYSTLIAFTGNHRRSHRQSEARSQAARCPWAKSLFDTVCNAHSFCDHAIPHDSPSSSDTTSEADSICTFDPLAVRNKSLMMIGFDPRGRPYRGYDINRAWARVIKRPRGAQISERLQKFKEAVHDDLYEAEKAAKRWSRWNASAGATAAWREAKANRSLLGR